MKPENTLSFNLNWYRFLQNYPFCIQKEVIFAALHYATSGELLKLKHTVSKVAFEFIRISIDEELEVPVPAEATPATPSAPLKSCAPSESSDSSEYSDFSENSDSSDFSENTKPDYDSTLELSEGLRQKDPLNILDNVDLPDPIIFLEKSGVKVTDDKRRKSKKVRKAKLREKPDYLKNTLRSLHFSPDKIVTLQI